MDNTITIHVGHIEYFKFSKRIGKKLLVIVNNDEIVSKNISSDDLVIIGVSSFTIL